jgi:hypothetical protein
VLALSGLGLGAPPAWAQDSRWTCAAQDKAPVDGELCGRFIGAGTGFDIRYTHMSGSAIQARFGLYDVATRSFRFDDGPFAMAGTGTRSFRLERDAARATGRGIRRRRVELPGAGERARRSHRSAYPVAAPIASGRAMERAR